MDEHASLNHKNSFQKAKEQYPRPCRQALWKHLAFIGGLLLLAFSHTWLRQYYKLSKEHREQQSNTRCKSIHLAKPTRSQNADIPSQTIAQNFLSQPTWYHIEWGASSLVALLAIYYGSLFLSKRIVITISIEERSSSPPQVQSPQEQRPTKPPRRLHRKGSLIYPTTGVISSPIDTLRPVGPPVSGSRDQPSVSKAAMRERSERAEGAASLLSCCGETQRGK